MKQEVEGAMIGVAFPIDIIGFLEQFRWHIEIWKSRPAW
jgi:hypothetical protein